MKLKTLALLSAIALPLSAQAQSIIYGQDFDAISGDGPGDTGLISSNSFGPDYFNGGSYVLNEWNAWNNGNTGSYFANDQVEVHQNGGATFHTGVAVLFDPSLFTDSVEYNISFSNTGANGTERFAISEITGTLDSDTGIKLVSLQNGTQGTVRADTYLLATGTDAGSATVSNIETVTGFGSGTVTSSNFTYNSGSIIGFAFSYYNAPANIDNFVITAVPEPSSFVIIAGALAIGFVALRRRK
jgi:hypothetical protein